MKKKTPSFFIQIQGKKKCYHTRIAIHISNGQIELTQPIPSSPPSFQLRQINEMIIWVGVSGALVHESLVLVGYDFNEWNSFLNQS